MLSLTSEQKQNEQNKNTTELKLVINSMNRAHERRKKKNEKNMNEINAQQYRLNNERERK